MIGRAASRARIIEDVLRLGRKQLAEVGAPALSLRAISRELGVVSSAVYRYFPSRDALLTALILESYNELGAAAERAERAVPRKDLLGRFLATFHAVRTWALANPNEFALIYGSPVPGYVAPTTTIGPASRVPLLLLAILQDLPADHRPPIAFDESAGALASLREAMAPDLDPGVLALGYMAWQFVQGAVSMEVFGHQTNVVSTGKRARRAFFEAQLRVAAGNLGLHG